MDKAEKREQKRFKNKHRPKGNPKFLILMVEQREKRDAAKVKAS